MHPRTTQTLLSHVCGIHTGAYDHTVKLWDVGSGTMKSSYDMAGFVQSVSFNPAGAHPYAQHMRQPSVTCILHTLDNNHFIVGTTQKQILMFDCRAAEAPSAALQNDVMVNSV